MESPQVSTLCAIRILPQRVQRKFRGESHARTEGVTEHALTTAQEAAKNEISFEDEEIDDPKVLGSVIYYLYHHEYNDAQDDVTPIVHNVRVFTMADRFFIHPLKKLAAEKFAACCKDDWNTDEFATVVEEIYTKAPQEDNTLKKIAISTVKEHAKELRKTEDEDSRFREVINRVPSVGADLFYQISLVDSLKTFKCTWYKCPSCDSVFVTRKPHSVERRFTGCGCYRSPSEAWWKDQELGDPEEELIRMSKESSISLLEF